MLLDTVMNRHNVCVLTLFCGFYAAYAYAHIHSSEHTIAVSMATAENQQFS